MKKWKTLQSYYVYKSPFGNLRKDTCELPDGQVIQDYYVNEYSDWVNAIVLTKEKEIVLVKQYRHAVGDFFLEIPAGKAEDNETYAEAIIREVKEETGFISDSGPQLLDKFFVNPATQTNKVVTFLIQEAYQAYGQDLDPTEFIDVHKVGVDEMGTMIGQGVINQLFTANAYYMFQSFIKSDK